MAGTVYISGAHSGSNPSPGLGTALSLREAFADIRLIGVDYSTASTGLHHPVFDDAIVTASWDQIDMSAHLEFVAECVEPADTWWLSGLDLEAAWLAANQLGDRVFVSPPATFQKVAKPARGVAEAMSLAVPSSTSSSDPNGLDLSFVDKYGWPVWVKGRNYEAFSVSGWTALHAAVVALERSWGSGVVIQQHVEGAEESIAFAVRRGALVGAVAMRKLATTAEGKTWAGEVRPLPIRETQQLAACLARVDWHGGGEIEIVRRTSDGRRFLIDVNPRFPAWIHGSTQASGVNLPAALVDSRASGRTVRSRFVRVVTEIPMRDDLHLQIPSTGIGGQPGAAGKHPSAMPQLSRRLAAQVLAPRPESVDEGVAAILDAVAERASTTPFEVFDYQGLAATLENVAVRSSEIGLIPALSIKTNPDPQILSIAHDAGWIAEAISGLEVEAATHAGWPATTVVLNGPAKAWPQTDTTLPYRAVFYDSVAELDAAHDRYPNASHLGFRLRPLRAKSRFGVDCSSPPGLKEAAVRMRELAETSSAASHIHFASSTIGLRAWASEVEANLAMVCALERLSGQRVRLIDIGGGFSPNGLSEFLSRQAGELVDRVRACLPGVEEIAFEPGKAVLAPHGYVVSRVLFRSDDDLYIDSSLADLPDTVSLRRPVYVRRGKGWINLPVGSGQVFGRSCIEEDIVARGLHVADLQSDDLLVFAYAGAYDTSMRYRFASAGLPIDVA